MNFLKKMSPQEQERFAHFVREFHPAQYAYFEEMGRLKRGEASAELGGFMDFLRSGGDFVAGLFGEGAQNLYRDFIQYDATGTSSGSGGVSMQQVIAMQEQARRDFEIQQAQTRNMMLMGIGGLAVVMVVMSKK